MTKIIRSVVVCSLALVLALLSARAVRLGLAGALCRAPVISDPNWRGVQLPGGPCLEYWLARYQSLIGASAALAAALIAWRSFRAQTDARVADQQRDAASATLQLFLTHMTLREMINRIKPNTMRHILSRNTSNADVLRGSVRVALTRIAEARDAYQNYVALWNVYRASDALKLKTATFNRKTFLYIDVISIFVSSVDNMALRIPSGPIAADAQAHMQGAIGAIPTDSSDAWAQYSQAAEDAYRVCQEVFAKHGTAMTKDEMDEVTAYYERRSAERRDAASD